MDISIIASAVKGVSEYGVLGLGWIAFFWAMNELKRARAAHDALVFQLVGVLAKLELIQGPEA